MRISAVCEFHYCSCKDSKSSCGLTCCYFCYRLSTNQAAAAEKHAREKEEAFNKDQVAKKRADELNETLQKLTEEAKHYDKSINPLNAEMTTKMSRRDYMRKENSAEEVTLGDTLRCFEKDEQRLHDVMEKIEEYLRSNNERSMEEIVTQISGNANMIKENQAKIESMKPEIDKLKKQVDDSEREKAKIKVSNRLFVLL